MLTTTIRGAALVACFGLATPAVADPAPSNYCHDPQAAEAWARLLANNPDDTGIQRLAALRAHLYKLVDTGSMTIETATSIFESKRDAEVRKRRPSIEDGQPVG